MRYVFALSVVLSMVVDSVRQVFVVFRCRKHYLVPPAWTSPVWMSPEWPWCSRGVENGQGLRFSQTILNTEGHCHGLAAFRYS